MGVLLSRFRRKQTTIEILEGIDKEISRLQRNRKVNQDRQKHIVTSLLIYSIVVYVFAAVIFFCVYFPDTWQLRLLYSLPLLVFPFLIWGIKKLLHWYFVKRISSNDLALQQLRERKKQILEDVVETETYKRAREILEKFDPGRLRKLERTVRTAVPVARAASSVTPRMSNPATPSPTQVLPRPRQPVTPFPSTPTFRQPQVRPLLQSPQPRSTATPRPQATGLPQPRTPFPSQPVTTGGYSGKNGPNPIMPPGLPMPRTVLPRERGTMDKLMDYLVGDGPENRYALICQHCSSHNGMALKEEFEYLSFRCCYCYNLNPAKKQRPLAPRLEFFAPGSSNRGQLSGNLSKTPSNDESDDEDDDEEEEEDGDSDQGSAGCDTSAGISPLQSGKSPPNSASAASSTSSWSSNRAAVTTKPKEVLDSKLQESRGPVVSQVKGPVALQAAGPVASVAKGSLTVEVKGQVAAQVTGQVAAQVKDALAGQGKGQVPDEGKVAVKPLITSKVTESRLSSSTSPRSEETKIPVVSSRSQQKEPQLVRTAGGVPATQAATVTGNGIANVRSDSVGKLKVISDNEVFKEGPHSPESTQGNPQPADVPDSKNFSPAISSAGARQEILPHEAVASSVPQDGNSDGDHVR
ncbi:unnamed protein product [Candidula unifasciata]|uniref:Endoplasmic reticulum junction formation protein lunapark n=1 Tax=Candidula unifasciata TaxID=100452 RepID=A0A8S3YRE9_9EUPU|nr:unnamed protein product [Candidula unifasciata]